MAIEPNKLTKEEQEEGARILDDIFMIDRALLALHKSFKLQIEPRTPLRKFSNIRDFITKKHWKYIQMSVFQKHDNICQICGGIGKRHPVECHEQWHIDDNSLTQRLIDLQCLCPSCHQVKHYFGSSGHKGNKQKMLSYFCEVNNIEKHIAEQIIDSVFYEMQSRKATFDDEEEKKWKLNIDLVLLYGIDPNSLNIDFDNPEPRPKREKVAPETQLRWLQRQKKMIYEHNLKSINRSESLERIEKKISIIENELKNAKP